MYAIQKNKRHLSIITLVAALLLMAAVWVYSPRIVSASDIDFSDGITVDSNLDGSDSNVGDNICDDGAGNCTLRAAIEEANATVGTQTIRFNITGAADFTNGGQNGYTIMPTSLLPTITDTLVINGYSQPGSQANTTVSPNPFDAILLVEIDGGSAGGIAGAAHNLFKYESGSANSEISGLVINNFGLGQAPTQSEDPTAIGVGADNIKIYGNYIGTDPSGLIMVENIGCAVCQIDSSDNIQIGGLLPAQRNVLSGNRQAGISPNTGSDFWTIQGNYIGVGSDGLTSIPNSAIGGSGGLSLDGSQGHLVGGSQPGATNVISGNNSFAIFPGDANNITIQGNIIGPDWKGDQIPGSPQSGGVGFPSFNGNMDNFMIGGTNLGEGNHIAYNGGPAVSIIRSSFGGPPAFNVSNISILGNRIHDNIAGSQTLGAASGGIGIDLMDIDFASFTLSNNGPTPNRTGTPEVGH